LKSLTSEINFSGLCCSLFMLLPEFISLHLLSYESTPSAAVLTPSPKLTFARSVVSVLPVLILWDLWTGMEDTPLFSGTRSLLVYFFTEHHLSLSFGSYCSSSTSKNIRDQGLSYSISNQQCWACWWSDTGSLLRR
jgi:hypothetical protein